MNQTNELTGSKEKIDQGEHVSVAGIKTRNNGEHLAGV